MGAAANSTVESVPFDKTAFTRGRHKCCFCDAHPSDEWKFLARLNAFICKASQEHIETRLAEERKTG